MSDYTARCISNILALAIGTVLLAISLGTATGFGIGFMVFFLKDVERI